MVGAAREDKSGWIIAKVQGSPRQIGYQVGQLLATEIDDLHKAIRFEMKQGTGKEWEWFRESAQKLFWDKLDKEYQEEIDGQVDALKEKGFAYDRWDVLAVNGHIELEGYYLPWLNKQPSNKEACSAFVATGSATTDGKPVIGHNMWWGYGIGQRWNVMLQITPQKGNRITMDALPGFIHSGSDFATTSAGLMITETTISGFAGFDPEGIPEFVRMRKATQYAKSIDEWVAIMKKGNNGGYANTWLLADANTGEIGKLELGLKNVILNKSKDGWFVGSNFPEDPKLIAEEVPGGWNADPKRNSCEQRRARWNNLLTENKGKVDAEKAKAFLADTYDEVKGKVAPSGSTLCGRSPWGGAVNSKVATGEMVKRGEVWARMGFSDGAEYKFPESMKKRTPHLRDIPSQPWELFSLSK